MVKDYAIKSIILVDVIDLRCIAIPIPFWRRSAISTKGGLFNHLQGSLRSRQGGRKVHFIAVSDGIFSTWSRRRSTAYISYRDIILGGGDGG